MPKNYVACLLMFGLLLGTSSFSQSKSRTKPASPSAIDVIEQIRASVVQVRATAVEGWSAGSGFVVAGKYVITNCHVVGICRQDRLLTNPSVIVAFRIPNFSTSHVSMKESFLLTYAQIVDTDLKNDLTVLKLADNIEMRLQTSIQTGSQSNDIPSMRIASAKLYTSDLKDGTDLFVSGFPFLEPSLVTQRGMAASAVERRDVPYLNEPQNDADVILFDGMINHGNSGGPVYLAQTGEVVGVAEAFAGTENAVVPLPQPSPPPGTVPPTPAPPSVAIANSGIGVAIPVKYVIALLAKNQIVAAAPAHP
jgi:S1-C subfamily serine protease